MQLSNDLLHLSNATTLLATLQPYTSRLASLHETHTIAAETVRFLGELGFEASLFMPHKLNGWQLVVREPASAATNVLVAFGAVFGDSEPSVFAKPNRVYIEHIAKAPPEANVAMLAAAFRSVMITTLHVDGTALGILTVAAQHSDPLPTTLVDVLVSHLTIALAHARATAEACEQVTRLDQRFARLRRAYDLVAAERRMLMAAFDAVSDAVLVIDAQGMVLLGNPALEAVVNQHPDLLIGHLLHHTPVPEPLVDLVQRARATYSQQEGELLFEDGRTFHISIAPVQPLDSPVQGYVALLKDVSHFKRLDEMRSQFVATVSHDIKSPLSIINGYTELLELSDNIDTDQRHFIERIKASSRRLMTLVTDLLDLARMDARVGMQFVLCDLGALVQTQVEGVRLRAHERQITLSLNVAPQLPRVYGDDDRLEQVVDNLLFNALTYTPKGGFVTVDVVTDANQVVFSIRDNGIGIEQEALQYIFEPFYRAESATRTDQEGSGLGLAIVKRIVENHHGTCGVETAVGQGSTFWFRLPRA